METALDLFLLGLRSAYGAERRQTRGLVSLRKRVSDAELNRLLGELHGSATEHVSRLETVFELVGEQPGADEAGSVTGILRDFSALARHRPAQQILDTGGAEAGLRLAAAGVIAYESLLHLGERAGVTHTTPRIADLLHACMRDARRAERKLRKLRETLVEELRAS